MANKQLVAHAARAVPEAAPRRLNVIVGRVSVGRALDFRTYPPPVAFCAKGGQVAIRFQYRLHEQSKEKDHWRFFLDCRMGADHPAPVTYQRTDMPGVTDLADGMLERVFDLPRRGRVSIEFEFGADHMRSDWRTAEVTHWEQRISNGVMRIQVV